MVDEQKVNRVVDYGKGIPGEDRAEIAADTTETAASTADTTPGWELPVLLFAGFRTLVDRLHSELAAQGHPGLRPAHGFALQAIGADGPHGTTASELGRRLGVSKQAAGKTADRLIALGYATTSADPSDARRKLVRLTPHGLDALTRSAAAFDALRSEWARTLGPARVRDLESALRAVVPPADRFRLDTAGWLGG
ncbi:MarR family winged helix-turn-helix transcriptional regulator [Streptomyces candidus]|uniref:DNA-binding MarR family transcriptional regulator n=1 Tax=Streptomyces candidus TaxID=67283 RepID=A0A7X0HDH2_9ACTN|nr:MarR family winged helix-turn-helix transcriptional regulator [Streptomyces candidus]MBB6435595.1 DNA-binding MarR family transcriptional regulator [Streptomyces candidus]GHH46886.1 MarR family transcriptional regulator [Streptomyces candidus]